MTQADDIRRTHHTAGQVRKVAEERCVSSSHDRRLGRDAYQFADGSGVTITNNRVSYQINKQSGG